MGLLHLLWALTQWAQLYQWVTSHRPGFATEIAKVGGSTSLMGLIKMGSIEATSVMYCNLFSSIKYRKRLTNEVNESPFKSHSMQKTLQSLPVRTKYVLFQPSPLDISQELALLRGARTRIFLCPQCSQPEIHLRRRRLQEGTSQENKTKKQNERHKTGLSERWTVCTERIVFGQARF